MLTEDRKASTEGTVSPPDQLKTRQIELHEALIQPRRGSAARRNGAPPGPIFTRWRSILRTSSGSVITARIRIGEPHRLQVNGAPGRAALVHLSDEPGPGGATFLGRDRT